MNKSSTICVDANVIIRLIVVPTDTAVQKHWEEWMIAETSIVAPSLLHYEIVNGFHQYVKQGKLDAQTHKSALETALSFDIKLVGDAELHRRASELAQSFNLPATYDAHYLALAERLDIELWTTDAKLFNTVRSAGVEWVKLVEK
jgi:predicted nucleic acid-binding protein